jgi:hypothetical protein
MSTAHVVATALLVLAALAEGAGVLMVVSEAKEARRLARRLAAEAHPITGFNVQTLPGVAAILVDMLNGIRPRIRGVGLLVAGIVLGLSGNLVAVWG